MTGNQRWFTVRMNSHLHARRANFGGLDHFFHDAAHFLVLAQKTADVFLLGRPFQRIELAAHGLTILRIRRVGEDTVAFAGETLVAASF